MRRTSAALALPLSLLSAPAAQENSLPTARLVSASSLNVPGAVDSNVPMLWYAYYREERSADECGRPDRSITRIGAAASTDRGRTWSDLGIILEAPASSVACSSTNRFVVGGVGDRSVMATRVRQVMESHR